MEVQNDFPISNLIETMRTCSTSKTSSWEMLLWMYLATFQVHIFNLFSMFKRYWNFRFTQLCYEVACPIQTEQNKVFNVKNVLEGCNTIILLPLQLMDHLTFPYSISLEKLCPPKNIQYSIRLSVEKTHYSCNTLHFGRKITVKLNKCESSLVDVKSEDNQIIFIL